MQAVVALHILLQSWQDRNKKPYTIPKYAAWLQSTKDLTLMQHNSSQIATVYTSPAVSKAVNTKGTTSISRIVIMKMTSNHVLNAAEYKRKALRMKHYDIHAASCKHARLSPSTLCGWSQKGSGGVKGKKTQKVCRPHEEKQRI